MYSIDEFDMYKNELIAVEISLKQSRRMKILKRRGDGRDPYLTLD